MANRERLRRGNAPPAACACPGELLWMPRKSTLRAPGWLVDAPHT